LSVGEKFINTIFSRARVIVEHTISGGKRCRMVKDVLRLTKEGISDRVMEIACGLHNLRVYLEPLVMSSYHLYPSFPPVTPACQV
jgi:hypothetical protein